MKHTNTSCGQNVTAGGAYSYHRASKGCITFLLCAPTVYFVTVSLSCM
jgi:hypothetical protein